VIDNAIVLSDRVFIKSPEVLQASQNFCEWYAYQKQVQNLSGLLVQRAALSDKTFDVMMY